MSSSALADLIKEVEHWLRLGTFLHEPLKEALLHVLHNKGNDPSYIGLPTDPAALFQVLDRNHRAVLNKLHPRVLQNDQMNLLFPPGKTDTDSNQFDITLIVILIRNCLNLPPPTNGWNSNNPPPLADQSIAANSIRARLLRNFHHHTNPKDINQQTFDDKWQEGVDIITALGYQYAANALKNACLDPVRLTILQSTMDALHNMQTDLRTDVEINDFIIHSFLQSIVLYFDAKQTVLEMEVQQKHRGY